MRQETEDVSQETVDRRTFETGHIRQDMWNGRRGTVVMGQEAREGGVKQETGGVRQET